METAAAVLQKYPELCLFLSIVLGHVIGAFHFKGVGFGNVVGTLIAGIVIGIIGKPELPDLLRWSFFYLFLFSIGYSMGPQFFGSLKKEALPQIAVAVVVAITGLATVIGVPYALNNIVLTIWGPIVVAVIHACGRDTGYSNHSIAPARNVSRGA